MTVLPRRAVAAGAGLLVGAMALGARAQQQIASIAVSPKITAKPFTFNPEKVKGLSADLLRSHHGLYAERVKRLNAIGDELAKLDFGNAPAEKVAELKREEHTSYNSSVLHELYFDGIAETPSRPSGLLEQAMGRDFGSIDRWKAEFVATSRTLTEGEGWVILAHSPRDRRLFNHWAGDDSMAPAGAAPLLAVDMYKHAYEADYGDDVAKYIDAFTRLIKWTNVERLYREAMRV